MVTSVSREITPLYLSDESESIVFANSLAKCLMPSAVITFEGDLGTGKTTIIRAILRALGIDSAIKSPTFSLVESYKSKSLMIHHFDLYRIDDDDELEYLGFRDYFSTDTVCFIEWPQKAAGAIKHIDLKLELFIKGDGRRLKLEACSLLGEKMLTRLMSESL